MKKVFLVILVNIVGFGCAITKTDVIKGSSIEGMNIPIALVSTDSKSNQGHMVTTDRAESLAVNVIGGDSHSLNMAETDLGSTNNSSSVEGDQNGVKYPGVSIPNMAKKERLNYIFIKAGKGEVDTNPYSDSGSQQKGKSNNGKSDKEYGIEDPVQKESKNRINLKTDAITNPKDENISANYKDKNDYAKEEKGSVVSNYKNIVGVPNTVKKEFNDKFEVKTGRSVKQENPVGTASGRSSSLSNSKGVSIPNPVQKSTNSFINTKTKGVGLWE